MKKQPSEKPKGIEKTSKPGEISEETKGSVDFVKEFKIEDVWTTGCALNTTGKIDN